MMVPRGRDLPGKVGSRGAWGRSAAAVCAALTKSASTSLDPQSTGPVCSQPLAEMAAGPPRHYTGPTRPPRPSPSKQPQGPLPLPSAHCANCLPGAGL